MPQVLIESRGHNVWGITLSEPTSNEDTVKGLPDVKKWIAQNVKGKPDFELFSSKYWYLVDKVTNNDETDYLKEIYLVLFIGNELLPDAKYSLRTRGYLDSRIILMPSDKELFEKHIKEGDEIELVSKDKKEKVLVFVTNIEIIAGRPNEDYEITYTLSRKIT